MQDPLSYLLPDEALKNVTSSQQHLFYMKDGKKVRIVFDDCIFDPQQIAKMELFKNYALKHNFDLSHVPDRTLMRYLYSYNFQSKETLQKLKIYLDWYSDPKIQRQDTVTLELINQGAIYTYGRDKTLRPIIILNVGIMDMEKYSLDDYLAAINQVINVVVDKLFIKGKLENYLFVIDMEGKGIGSLPVSTVREIVLKLSYIYSMRMGRLLIVNCNTLVKFMYSAVSPFLADVTKEKIKLLSESQVQKGKILQFVDSNQLEKKYGGGLNDLDEKWPPRVPGKQFMLPNSKNENLKMGVSEDLKSGLLEAYGQGSETERMCWGSNQCVTY